MDILYNCGKECYHKADNNAVIASVIYCVEIIYIELYEESRVVNVNK